MGLFSRGPNHQLDKLPKLLEVAGYAFHYAAGDVSGRPCILVTGNGGSTRIRLAPVEVIETREYTRPEMDQIKSIAGQHEAAWVENWHKGAAA